MVYLTILLLVAYLIGVKFVAYFAGKKKILNTNDYFVVGGSLRYTLLFATIIATVVNALAFTGVPALVMEGGILYLYMYIVALVFPSCIFIFGRKVNEFGKKHDIITQGQLFGKYFDSRLLQVVVSLIAILSCFPFLAIQISAIGKILSISTNGFISYNLSVYILALSVGLYLIIGGARAVVWTDVVQGIILYLTLMVTALLFTYWQDGYINGLAKLSELIPEKLTFNEKNLPVFIDRAITWPLAFFLWPQAFQRLFMAKSPNELKKTSIFTFIAFIVAAFCTMTIGIMSTAEFYGTGIDRDKLVATMYNKYFQTGASIMVLAIFAAGMSTIDSILLTVSSIVTKDIFPTLSNEKFSERKRYNIARIVSFLLLILVCYFALSEIGRGAITPLVTLGASFATLLIWPLINFRFLKNTNPLVLILTLIIGFSSIIISNFTEWLSFQSIGSATISFILSLVTFILLYFLIGYTKEDKFKSS